MQALLVVDIQNDFCPGGALEVPNGDEVIPVANETMKKFPLVVATQDWHPANHGSFAANHPWRRPGDVIRLDGLEQILWPMHCVQGSFGAEFARELDTSRFQEVFVKGTDPQIDSYSGFYDNGHRKSTGLGEYLRERGVEEVFILGLTLDYCVRFSVLDALELGFKTHLIIDGTRGVNLSEGDSDMAVAEMSEKGAIIVTSGEV
ncbi:MAG: bifunctional nicotinamidase/pyrazinamidase [Phaeodactylibacter sp.]|nr:bifunctional nicotinamidase/pyrazinamidase [Phaeodactylibacter sp.]MCB9293787.1 bifunctional nicotinamidase/pyrazinamidase [Lewinellaceae bacterium]